MLSHTYRTSLRAPHYSRMHHIDRSIDCGSTITTYSWSDGWNPLRGPGSAAARITTPTYNSKIKHQQAVTIPISTPPILPGGRARLSLRHLITGTTSDRFFRTLNYPSITTQKYSKLTTSEHAYLFKPINLLKTNADEPIDLTLIYGI